MGPANGFVSTSFFAFFKLFRAFLVMLLSRVRFAIVFLLSLQTRFAEPPGLLSASDTLERLDRLKSLSLLKIL